MDGLLKVSLNVDLLAQLHKDAGHPRVLTDGQVPLPGPAQVVPEQVQGVPGQGPGLGGPAGLQGGGYVGGQDGVGPDT